MDFENQLSEEQCEHFFEEMFGNIWTYPVLEKIVFPDGFHNSKAFNDFQNRNIRSLQEESVTDTEFKFIAEYFGNSLWEIFSNNHSVFSVKDTMEFSLGTWRSSGSFIAGFIERHSKELQFDYMAFYMGHFNKDEEAENSYKHIFSQLKNYGFDWQYEYPSLGIIDFAKQQPDNNLSSYNPNNSIQDDINKKNLLVSVNEYNIQTKQKINNSPTPQIILAYINIFKKYPNGWEDI